MTKAVRVTYNADNNQYAVYYDTRFLGFALDLQAVCDLIHLLEQENE